MDRQYPIGKFSLPSTFTPEIRTELINELSDFPVRLRKIAESLTEEQLNATYRDGSWTARQVIHHLPDSHLNAYVRIRLALTENNPAVKPYDEESWAELSDAKHAPIASSLCLLDGLHQRWVLLLRKLSDADFERTCYIPYFGKNVSVEAILAIYAWHGKHHLEHVKLVLGSD